MYKIEAIVMASGHEAFVLSECPNITYERHGKYLLGLDEYGVFANSYSYDEPSRSWQAFGGRKFEIPMTDGSVIEANGQWWDGGSKTFTEALGCNIVHATAKEIAALKKCYVFSSLSAVEEELASLRKTYTGRIFEYWEYECFITGNCAMWNRDPKNPKNIGDALEA